MIKDYKYWCEQLSFCENVIATDRYANIGYWQPLIDEARIALKRCGMK